jgi:predicted house-cleaning noncanonical NTP pyrophosphatase (MazG superfamily)
LVQEFNKAVRDKIPEIIMTSGKSCNYISMQDDEFLTVLEAKLAEEVKEYDASRTVDELIDILEVVYRIGELRGISKLELDGLKERKVQERGNFSRNLFLLTSAA